jgi:hypothetical protein
MLALQAVQGVAQELDRDVDRDIAPRLERPAFWQLPAPRSTSVRPRPTAVAMAAPCAARICRSVRVG